MHWFQQTDKKYCNLKYYFFTFKIRFLYTVLQTLVKTEQKKKYYTFKGKEGTYHPDTWVLLLILYLYWSFKNIKPSIMAVVTTDRETDDHVMKYTLLL